MRILRETGSRKNGLWKGVRINSRKQRLKNRNGVVNICFACLISLLCLLNSPTGYMILMQPFRKILYPYLLFPLLLCYHPHTQSTLQINTNHSYKQLVQTVIWYLDIITLNSYKLIHIQTLLIVCNNFQFFLNKTKI